MVDVGYIILSNGVKLPRLGLGTWLGGNFGVAEFERQKTALRTALDAGYRYIDTAHRYRNEALIGEVLQEYYDARKFKREDIFITTKLPFYGHQNPEKYLSKSLADLHTDYIDLYLMHTPLPTLEDEANDNFAADVDGRAICVTEPPLVETWRFFESRYRDGILRAIGVSNFNAAQLQDLYDKAEVKPQNLQIELHILHPHSELLSLCQRLGISVTSYGTLGSPGSGPFRRTTGDCLGHPLVVELAKKYGRTPAQILLCHFVQKGISVIPKSVTPVRLSENIAAVEFTLDEEDAQRLDAIPERCWLFTFDFLRHHPWFPFLEQEEAAKKQRQQQH